MDLGLSDVHVLVTGAAGGIGLEVTKLFLDQGAKVTAQYRSTSEPLTALMCAYGDKTLNPHGDLQLCTHPAELSQESDLTSLFDVAEKNFGTVNVLIVNHGVFIAKDVAIREMTLDQWNKTINANLTSAFLVCREYLNRLKQDNSVQEASIVLIGSTAGKYGEANHADYAASKSAMMYGLMLSLKNEIVEIAPRGRVNCVAPGWVATSMATESLKNFEILYRSLATTPLKKVAQAEDIAMQVVMLSSSKLSGHVTGQVVMVDGGMEGRLLNKPDSIQSY